MAGHGPAPKDASERRNRSVKGRGEWIDLPAENTNPAPPMPAPVPDGGWLPGTKQAWASWWRDPVSLLWGPADVEALRQLAYLTHEFDAGNVRVAPEMRLRLDGLGLTQKGRRDLRWRVAEDEVASRRPSDEPRTSRYDHLRSVQ